MNAQTQAIVNDIQAAADAGTLIAPATFTHCHGRQFVSAAFRVAKARGIIVNDYTSVMGTPVYRKALRLAD